MAQAVGHRCIHLRPMHLAIDSLPLFHHLCIYIDRALGRRCIQGSSRFEVGTDMHRRECSKPYQLDRERVDFWASAVAILLVKDKRCSACCLRGTIVTLACAR